MKEAIRRDHESVVVPALIYTVIEGFFLAYVLHEQLAMLSILIIFSYPQNLAIAKLVDKLLSALTRIIHQFNLGGKSG